MEQGEGSAPSASTPAGRVDLAAAAGPAWVAWSVAAGGWLVVFLVCFAVAVRYVGVGFVAMVPAFGWLYLVSWWRAERMSRSLSLVEDRVGATAVTLRVRSARSAWVVWAGTNTDLTFADGWCVLGDQRWPAGAVQLGREPNFWSSRPSELLTPSGPVGVSLVPKGDVGMYLATLVDRRARPLLAQLLAEQAVVGGGGAPPGWYPDPWSATAWRWWDGAAWGAGSP